MSSPHPTRPNGIYWTDSRDGARYQITTYLLEPIPIPGRSLMPRQQIPMIRVSGVDGSRLTMGTEELLDPGELDDAAVRVLVDRVKSLHTIRLPSDGEAV